MTISGHLCLVSPIMERKCMKNIEKKMFLRSSKDETHDKK
jgi:hypothetical protein